jgi:hypothetical protein
MAKTKTFKANLKSNPAIPGVVSSNDGDYLRNVERRAHAELENRNINQRTGLQIGRFIQQAQHLQEGNENRIQALAERVIRQFYGNILDGVELNLRLVPFGTVFDETPRNVDVVFQTPPIAEQEELAEEAKREQEQRIQNQPQHQNTQPTMQRVTDEDIAFEVHKRKLINNIIQGEGKNTHRLIHAPEVREELDNINPQLFETYDNVLKIAEFFDWTIPTQQKLEMMEEMPQGHGGFVSVDWKQPDGFDMNNDDDEEGGGDIGEFQENQKIPVINAIGVDFCMLIHETVKGVYELIASAAIHPDAEIAKTVLLNTDTLADEIEDLRYGPFIAGDIRDFINQNNATNDYENIREHLFGKIIQLPSSEFLSLIKEILLKTPTARLTIDEMITDIVSELRQHDLDIRFSNEDYNTSDDDNVMDSPRENIKNDVVEDDVIEEIDYSNMSKDDLQAILDHSLDEGDFETVSKIAPFLKLKN